MRGEALLDLRTAETQHLQRQRRIEGRPHRAQPVVERVFCPADGTLRPLGQSAGDLDRLSIELRIIDRDGLVEAANGSYGVPEAEYERLFG